MRFLTQSALICALFAPTLASAQTAGGPTGDPTLGDPADSGGAFPLADGDGVTFSQVIFDTEEGPVVSRIGKITVDPVRVSRTLGEPAGFINVHTARGWVALNIPVDTDVSQRYPRVFAGLDSAPPVADLPVTVYFDLGRAKRQTSIKGRVVYSPHALMHAEQYEELQVIPTSKFRVFKAHQTQNEGGLDLAAQGPGPLPPPPQNPSFAFPEPLVGYWARMTPNPINIEAGRNQCVPIAAANALGYLRETFGATRGLVVPHNLQKGVVDGVELAARLDALMDRPVTTTCVGSGTGYCPDEPGDSGMLTGLSRYLWQWNIARLDRINFRYQGTRRRVNDELCAANLEVDTTEEGDEVTFEWLCDRIEAGDGIILNYDRVDGNEQYTGGHSIRVHGCGEMGGVPFIRVLNDTWQDGMSGDACNENPGLESQMVYLEDLDGDGRLNYGIMGREIAFALAVSIDP